MPSRSRVPMDEIIIFPMRMALCVLISMVNIGICFLYVWFICIFAMQKKVLFMEDDQPKHVKQLLVSSLLVGCQKY